MGGVIEADAALLDELLDAREGTPLCNSVTISLFESGAPAGTFETGRTGTGRPCRWRLRDWAIIRRAASTTSGGADAAQLGLYRRRHPELDAAP